MRRKSLSHGACVRKLNQQLRRHPDYREGMQVTQIGGGLCELQPPEDLDSENPQTMEEARANPELQRILWDSVPAVEERSCPASALARRRMLSLSLLSRLTREGRRRRRLQKRLRRLYRALIESKLHFGLWPAAVTPLIQRLRLRDPWQPGELLQVAYTPPAEGTSELHREHVLAEYVREGRRKFTLYADGHQETCSP